MIYPKRIKRLQYFFGFLGILLFLGLGYRMLWQRETLQQRVFSDDRMAALLQQLADERIITPTRGGGVAIDEKKLEKRISRPALRTFILNRRRYLSFEDGQLEIDPAALSVGNRRLAQSSGRLYRGHILDRNGKILAETVEKKGGQTVREYPLGKAALPLLGVAHPVYGLKGIEEALAPYLEGSGDKGGLSWLYRFFAGKKQYFDAVLSIDARIQKTAFEAIDNTTGAVVVLDVDTGDILAAASSPSFDPASPAGEAWDKAATLGYRGPFINRAFQRRYPPGSVFKLITATAWLEQPNVDLSWDIICKGVHPKFSIGEHAGAQHGKVNLQKAFSLSCNVFFAEEGVRLGPLLAVFADRFGFNRTFPLAGDDVSEGIMVESIAFCGTDGISAGGRWTESDFARNPKLVAQGAIGQNTVFATPLQIAMVAACLANNGELMAPGLLKQIRYSDRENPANKKWFDYKTYDPRTIGRVCSEKTAQTVLQMMGNVMEKGTGSHLKKIYRENGRYHLGSSLPEGARNLLAGKTGTAETRKGEKDHSWFVAVAPIDKPQYVVAVIVEYGGLGAKSAGPVAVSVMADILGTAQY